jgi:predicted N-formylglutamate amidohydrolase
VMSCFSRLLIDPNRGEDDPTLIMQLYDGSIIPGNRSISPSERQTRLDRFWRPYHKAVADQLAQIEDNGLEPLIISIHSFTPCLNRFQPRPWHIGVLWGEDERLAKPLAEALKADQGLVIGMNEPYRGGLKGDTLYQHGIVKNRQHVLIEVRQDLITSPADNHVWADRLTPFLRKILIH